METKEQLITRLSDKERFCLIGYLQTADQLMAYICSRKRQTEASPEALRSMASRWMNSAPVQAFLEAERGRKAILLDEVMKNRSKEDVVVELNKLATIATEPKLKAEILLKLSDLEGWKKSDTKDEGETIHYYLPLRCNVCELYKAAKEKTQIITNTKRK